MCGLEMPEVTLIRANTRLLIRNKKLTGVFRKNILCQNKIKQ